MAEYFIAKRERCKCYYGVDRAFLSDDDKTLTEKQYVGLNLLPDQSPDDARCKVFGCLNGYIDTPVDLLEVLGKLRWSNSAVDFSSPSKLGDNLRIEEGE